MSQNTRESLSVLMDSESDELELRRVLKALPDDDDAAETWRRYHLARSMMRRERDVDVSVDLSAGVMARLQGEPAPALESDTPPARTGNVSFARGAGVAAAVSLMVITGVQFFGSGGGTPEQGGNVASSSVPASSNQVQPVNLASLPSVDNGQSTGVPSSQTPMFEQTPFRLSGQSSGSGLMNVSEGGFSVSQQGVSAQQGMNIDVEQLRMLQSYLEQQTQGAAGGQDDQWMPLMRSSGVTEPLGQR
ncbi:sigma-E factor negative regulatory protein [Halomonas sp. CUBES01]|uniref:Sigma-E factor negative regulatory protein n=1 Tax=Vreelandella gomseomensis TaxID=370766 RepID=A0ABU1G942_9GAMM|nr:MULTISPECIES: sigma-E factor negative regulatory protein [Halomonas]MDR5874011.1 sigma-E factor negative regulatory protein [Halomonas gomseomensis]MEC4767087.1 sigma-E factor negative regulatory protein [Halomonas sp. CUBES01]